jgi:hypothetical protein
MENNNTGVIPEFTRNSNGVRIKKCCASCRYKEPYNFEGSRRKCMYGNMGMIVDKSDLCGRWHISETTDKIQLKRGT